MNNCLFSSMVIRNLRGGYYCVFLIVKIFSSVSIVFFIGNATTKTVSRFLPSCSCSGACTLKTVALEAHSARLLISHTALILLSQGVDAQDVHESRLSRCGWPGPTLAHREKP